MLHLFGASTYYFILNLSTIYAFTSRLPCLTLASLLTSLLPLSCLSSLLSSLFSPLCWRLVFAEDDAFYFVNLVFELLVGVDHVGYGLAAVKHCCVVSSSY